MKNSPTKIQTKLHHTPNQPGVYYHKDKDGRFIYIGKAVDLKQRLRSYFHKTDPTDFKTKILASKIADFDYQTTNNEMEALFLEAEMIQRYQPLFNIKHRSGPNNGIYIRLDWQPPAPYLDLVYQPQQDDGVRYFGPYLKVGEIKKALKTLRPIFPYSTHKRLPKRACLQYHLGLCPGPETNDFDYQANRKNLDLLAKYFRGQVGRVSRDLKRQMTTYATQLAFEKAASCRRQIEALQALSQPISLPTTGLNKTDLALISLQNLLGLKQPPQRLEAFDVSHQSGQDNSASLVVFVDGLPARQAYRRFKLPPTNNDYSQLAITLRRRFRPANVKHWGKPNLILIDGGKGQVGVTQKVLDELQLKLVLIGLAKQNEQIIYSTTNRLINVSDQSVAKLSGSWHQSAQFGVIDLPDNCPGLLLLRRLRDESHRFALSYHRNLKHQRQTASQLLKIDQLGPARYRQLLSHFGSLKHIKQASLADLKAVVGPRLAQRIKKTLKQLKLVVFMLQ